MNKQDKEIAKEQSQEAPEKMERRTERPEKETGAEPQSEADDTGKPETQGDAGPSMLEISQEEYEKLVQESRDYKDRYIRLCAEFDNARKRFDREKSEFVKYANEALLKDFLNILDDLERSVEAASAKHQDYDAFLKGVEMIMAHIHELLKRHDVCPIQALGGVFDPHRHEILMQEPSEHQEDGQVVEEFQKGYMIGDRVIRTAKVKVAVYKGSS